MKPLPSFDWMKRKDWRDRGQKVRVEGTLIDPESRQLLPALQVQAFRVEEP